MAQRDGPTMGQQGRAQLRQPISLRLLGRGHTAHDHVEDCTGRRHPRAEQRLSPVFCVGLHKAPDQTQGSFEAQSDNAGRKDRAGAGARVEAHIPHPQEMSLPLNHRNQLLNPHIRQNDPTTAPSHLRDFTRVHCQ